MPDEIKTSVLGKALASTQSKFSTLTNGLTQSFAPVFGKQADGTSALPGWVVPLVLLAAAGWAAVKFLPKVFNKGRSTRTASRRR